MGRATHSDRVGARSGRRDSRLVGTGGDPDLRWVDTHGHVQLTPDPAAVLRHGMDGVAWLVAPGVDVQSSQASVELQRSHPDRIRSSAGLHPHEAVAWADVRDEIAELAANATAVGETGLDFYRNLSPRECQLEAFTDQIRLARSLGRPLIVHCRDAFSETYDALSGEEPGAWVVLHCWTGGPKWTKRFLELGVTFSFAGPVAFETGDTVRRGAAVVPPSRALVETDTPYLSPPPYRGETNVPARVALVGEALAGVWGVDVATVATITTRNAARVFGDV